MKLEYPKKWFERPSEIEGNSDVGAGCPAPTRSARDAFEAWIQSPPFERSVARFPEGSAWTGNYLEIDIDLAWCAWQDAAEYWQNAKASDR
jgi:hypothetical protein